MAQDVLSDDASLGALIGRQPLALEQATVEVTVSGGIVVFQPEAEDENRLLYRADQALYIAKNSGRDFAVVAAPG